jgi:hypothetical protein
MLPSRQNAASLARAPFLNKHQEHGSVLLSTRATKARCEIDKSGTLEILVKYCRAITLAIISPDAHYHSRQRVLTARCLFLQGNIQ